MGSARPKTVAEYINSAPAESKRMLKEIRALLQKAAPKAKESIKWGYPVMEEQRILFSYSAHKKHLNFMPTQQSLLPFEDELAEFKTGKDTVQFPYERPLPKSLILKIAKHRVKDVRENDAKWMYK